MRPLTRYHELYSERPRRYAVPATNDAPTWEAWRVALRQQLWARLGEEAVTHPPVVARTLVPTQHAGYRREYVEFEGEPGSIIPAWVLIPDGLTTPGPAVIALHGHGYGVDDIVGITAGGTDRLVPAGYQQDFAVALCQRGFIVIAPELLAFGRRREVADIERGADACSCHAASLWGIMLGRPLLGRRVADVLRTIEYLSLRVEVDAARIGIMGISGGGTVALYAAALDPRLRAIVLSGSLCSFKDSILAIDHCLCNYVPGILEDAEMYDIAALLAPRPLLVESGTRDPIFPIASVKEAYAEVRRAYAVLGVEERLASDFFEGDHRISGALAYDFLLGSL